MWVWVLSLILLLFRLWLTELRLGRSDLVALALMVIMPLALTAGFVAHTTAGGLFTFSGAWVVAVAETYLIGSPTRYLAWSLGAVLVVSGLCVMLSRIFRRGPASP